MDNEQISRIVTELLEENLTTLEYYFDVYEEELGNGREELHHKIIWDILEYKTYSRGKTIHMLGGAPANGKSSFLRSGIVTYPTNALKIDPDKIKQMLPEYQFMTANQEPLAAIKVHEESSVIAREIKGIALDKGYDLILDGVADDTLERRTHDVVELKRNGHSIRMDYVSLDAELSLQLAEIRFQETGRQVPEEFIKEKNRIIALLLPQLLEVKLFDELYLWDTNEKDNPRLVLWQKSGKLIIENEELYNRFKLKANG